MDEVKKGEGHLISRANPHQQFRVGYHIDIHTFLEDVRSGLPPVARMKANVRFVRSTENANIPEGDYNLHTEDEIIHLSNLGIGGWNMLA